MKLMGKIITSTRIVKDAVVVRDDENTSFRDVLEGCLIQICKDLDVQVPIWLKKNTTEFANYHKTTFEKDQFVEKIKFDKLEISIEL
jgi:hypothetical protein